MHRQITITDEQDLWLVNLNELANKVGMSEKQIADKTGLSLKAVNRVFAGESKNPGIIPVKKIIRALGGSMEEIFADSDIVLGGKDLATLQAEVDTLQKDLEAAQKERDMLVEERERLVEENATLLNSLNLANEMVETQKKELVEKEQENQKLQMTVAHKEEVISLKNELLALNDFYRTQNLSAK